MKNFKTVSDVWEALDQGKTVYWTSKSYRVYIEPNVGSEEQKNVPCRLFSARKDFVLSVRCISNYFGSVLHEGDLFHLFTESAQ